MRQRCTTTLHIVSLHCALHVRVAVQQEHDEHHGLEMLLESIGVDIFSRILYAVGLDQPFLRTIFVVIVLAGSSCVTQALAATI